MQTACKVIVTGHITHNITIIFLQNGNLENFFLCRTAICNDRFQCYLFISLSCFGSCLYGSVISHNCSVGRSPGNLCTILSCGRKFQILSGHTAQVQCIISLLKCRIAIYCCHSNVKFFPGTVSLSSCFRRDGRGQLCSLILCTSVYCTLICNYLFIITYPGNRKRCFSCLHGCRQIQIICQRRIRIQRQRILCHVNHFTVIVVIHLFLAYHAVINLQFFYSAFIKDIIIRRSSDIG